MFDQSSMRHNRDQGMRKESPYSLLWCSSARKGPRIRSARVSQMARLAHDGVLASIEMRIYNIQDYNNNYGMKAARRRYLIYINEDEGIKLCPQNVFSCVQVSPSTACGFSTGKVLLLQDQSRCRLAVQCCITQFVCLLPLLGSRARQGGED